MNRVYCRFCVALVALFTVFIGLCQSANAQWRELGPVSVLHKRNWSPAQCDYRLRLTYKDLCFATQPPECTTFNRYINFQEKTEATTRQGTRAQAAHDWYLIANIFQTPGQATDQFKSVIDQEDSADYERYAKEIRSASSITHGAEISLSVSDFKSPVAPHAMVRNVQLELAAHQVGDIGSFNLDKSKIFLQELCPHPSPSPTAKF